LHEKHAINEVQEYLNKTGIVKVIQYSPLTALGIAVEMGIKYSREFDRKLNAVLRKIGFDRVYSTGAGTDVCITELSAKLADHLQTRKEPPLYISSCPSWIKYAEQFMPEILPHFSGVKSPQQLTGALIKTIVARQHGVKPERVFSVSATPCIAMKFEARRDGMMRNGISDVDSVLTVKELVRLIRLYGIDITNVMPEQFDNPLSGRSSSAVLAEVSGGLAEGVARLWYFQNFRKEIDRHAFKKLRLTGAFREAVIPAGETELRIAVVDGLTGLEKLKASIQSGNKYSIVEVMTCPGGCIHGAGLSYSITRDEIKSRARQIYHTDETEAITLPCKSPTLLDIYENLLPENKDVADKSIFYTHYEKRNVLR
jgi:NADH-quinone oxidoreductase subunit G/NADP-reducing hydrogenase subunit HndD